MTTRAELRRRPSGAQLSTTRLAAELVTISRDGIEVSFDETGKVRARMAVDREDALSFPVDISPDGDQAVARVVQPYDAIVNWSFLELGHRLDCDVRIDGAPAAGGDDEAARRVLLASAISDIQDYERKLLEDRGGAVDALRAATPTKPTPVRGLIEALAAKGEIVLVAGQEGSLGVFEELIDKPDELYEALLDSPAIDEIFLDEAQFKKRWKKL